MLDVANNTNTIHAPPDDTPFQLNAVQYIHDRYLGLLDQLGQPLPLLANLLIEKDLFTGTIRYHNPEDTYFITSNQLIANKYTGEILRLELQLRIGEFQSLRYHACAPTLETMVRILALSAPRPSEAKGVNQFTTVDSIIGAFKEWFPDLNPTKLSKTSYISRTTVYNILDSDTPGTTSMTGFLKLIQAAAEINNVDQTEVWEDLLNA